MKLIYFFIVLFIAYIVQLLCKFQIINSSTFITSYFSDLLAIPTIASFSLICIRRIKNKPNLKLGLMKMLFLFLYTSVLFEIVLPIFSPKFTKDYYDILMYLIGTLFYATFEYHVLK